MTDQGFTAETGVRVKFSVMPDESKLVLANAAGIQPDVALGVSTNQPYELAIRGALQDLRGYDDFDSYIRHYSPGALLSYIIDDSVYALPETQDFWVTFYRRDILDSLGLPVPDTWTEVIELLPELQRFGLNYHTPLSTATGSKGLLATAPYLFNHGAQLYSANGFASGLASDEAVTAMKFMAESFTLYGMPLQTGSFYDSFRSGSLPLGVANFTTYIELLTAAPELEGRWGLALYPATVLPDGTENRYATGSAQASIMFAKTQQPEAAWEFLKWWMSTETQVDFQQQLVLNYGIDLLWSSANIEAFALAPIPEEHKAVILEQWEWLQEPVKLPGSYMQEREITNAWNRIVFEGVNPRVAIDSSVVIVNREITRKMEEFGYLENGVKVREFQIPTIETVKRWMDEAD
jgi:ABC-type glycerol-3-phosphate transport system substrate-binding protein